jgi:hypothetical protein
MLLRADAANLHIGRYDVSARGLDIKKGMSQEKKGVPAIDLRVNPTASNRHMGQGRKVNDVQRKDAIKLPQGVKRKIWKNGEAGGRSDGGDLKWLKPRRADRRAEKGNGNFPQIASSLFSRKSNEGRKLAVRPPEHEGEYYFFSYTAVGCLSTRLAIPRLA